MLTRIVKMEFIPEFTPTFPGIFKEVEQKIMAFPGCLGVQLKTDIAQPDVFFTISIWESEAALNIYRDSALFKETWQLVKPNFCTKALAWSLADPK